MLRFAFLVLVVWHVWCPAVACATNPNNEMSIVKPPNARVEDFNRNYAKAREMRRFEEALRELWALKKAAEALDREKSKAGRE
jgi:hypothetical protein